MSAYARTLAASAVVLLLTLALVGLSALQASAQSPSEAIEQQAFEVEKQLLCPQCTNKRLDTCEIEICQDMRAEIRRQLAAGADSQDIVAFFEQRYGQRVLASLPKDGFNLWLWAWVLASTGLIAFAGGLWMVRQRRQHRERVAALPDEDDSWLESAETGGGR